MSWLFTRSPGRTMGREKLGSIVEPPHYLRMGNSTIYDPCFSEVAICGYGPVVKSYSRSRNFPSALSRCRPRRKVVSLFNTLLHIRASNKYLCAGNCWVFCLGIRFCAIWVSNGWIPYVDHMFFVSNKSVYRKFLQSEMCNIFFVPLVSRWSNLIRDVPKGLLLAARQLKGIRHK